MSYFDRLLAAPISFAGAFVGLLACAGFYLLYAGLPCALKLTRWRCGGMSGSSAITVPLVGAVMRATALLPVAALTAG